MNKLACLIISVLILSTVNCSDDSEKNTPAGKAFEEVSAGTSLMTAGNISRNFFKKSLPDVAYNSVDDNFFAFWAAAPESSNSGDDNYIIGRKISSSGEIHGEPVIIYSGDYTTMMPKVLHNSYTNQYMVIYAVMEGYMNIRGVVIDTDGNIVVQEFKVTDGVANQFHYSMAFNSTDRQFIISYNDSRTGAGDIYAVILSETGTVVKAEFVINDEIGHQVNPVVCYNSQDNTYLFNWEDFRHRGPDITAYGTLDVTTDIYGALFTGNGTESVNDIAMCIDDGDQRFNQIVYNTGKNEFLVSWTDAKDSMQNVGISGRIVDVSGDMAADDFTLVDSAGAQMIGHTHYLSEHDEYFIALEFDDDDLDLFYFKDITAHLDIGAMWIDSTGDSIDPFININQDEGNQRFVRFAHDTSNDSFLLIWQDDFPGVSDTESGHIMSAGGNISGVLYSRD